MTYADDAQLARLARTFELLQFYLQVLIILYEARGPLNSADLRSKQATETTVAKGLRALIPRKFIERTGPHPPYTYLKTERLDSFFVLADRYFEGRRQELFTALSAASRIKLLLLLDEHPRSVTQLSKDMGVQQPVVSTHLSMLERLDLVNEPGKQQKNLPRRILSTGAAHELLAFCRAQLKVESELEDKIVSDEENDQ